MNEATKRNLQRKSFYIDNVQLFEEKVLFSWIDINLTELCNRKCIFCPRASDDKYPNQALHMDLTLIQKIADELKKLSYQGSIVFAGFGEPLLYPYLVEASKILKDYRLEIVTNGDKLSIDMIHSLYNNGVDLICVSLYDNSEQVNYFKQLFSKAGIQPSQYVLRDRWHTKEDGFGLKLTNRAGMVSIGEQEAVNLNNPCYYPHYSLTIDWNGDVLLCVQDWNKKTKAGNLYTQTMCDIWYGSILNKYRRFLGNGNRRIYPCNQCNADGTLHGFNHINYWRKEQ